MLYNTDSILQVKKNALKLYKGTPHAENQMICQLTKCYLLIVLNVEACVKSLAFKANFLNTGIIGSLY